MHINGKFFEKFIFDTVEAKVIQIDTVYLDFRKAFDSVPHKRLIKKLEGYGIKGILLEWFKNFLNGRQQRVVINGKNIGLD